MKIRILALIFGAVANVAHSDLEAQIPQVLNYQGRVVVGATNFDGIGQFKFALVNANGSTTYWSNDGTSTAGSQPTNAVSLTVSKGLYSVLLGDTTIANMTVAIPLSVFNNSDVRLRVWFNDGTTGSQLLSPDQRIASVGYSMIAGNVPDGVITAAKIVNGAIGSAQIASGAVGSAQMANGSVGATQITDSSITAAKIGPGQVVKSINSLKDAVTLAAGSNVSITPSGNTLTLASTGGAWSLNGTNAFYNGGGVGVGTSSPNEQLEIAASTGGRFIASDGGGASRRALLLQAPTSTQAYGRLVSYNYGSSTGMNLAINDTGGNVGIGTTAPVSKLHILSGAADLPPRLQSSGTNGFAAGWDFYQGSTGLGYVGVPDPTAFFGAGEMIVFGGDSTPVSLWAARTRGLTVTTSGNIGIGTPAPAAKLEVSGRGIVESGITSTDDRAIVTLNSTIALNNRVWTIENGLFGNAGFFGIYDRTAGKARLTIDTNGTVSVPVLSITGGADVAEPFQMGDEQLEKGAVVVIDNEHPGRLKRSRTAYDKRVAGIISGANGVNPGISLHQEGAMEGGQNVALSGRVYVQAETSNGAIEPGDMLTTSDSPGYAMKVTDHSRAQGAVIGKAMTPLKQGSGQVLVLVTLQ
jgi:hypothetical protein